MTTEAAGGSLSLDAASRSVARAQVLLDQGRFDLAEKELGLALSAEPDDWQALALHGYASAKLKRFATAIRDVEAALEVASDQPGVHAVHSLVLLESQRYALAESAAREAIRMQPKDAEYLAILGSARLGQRDWAGALHAFDQALEIEPSASRLAARALSLVHLNRLGEARASANASLAVNPASTLGQAVKGYLALHDGQVDKSVDAFRESLRLDPTNEFALEWIREASLGRSAPYRLVQRFQLWSDRSGEPRRWAATGALAALRFIPGVGALIFLWVLWSWIATPIVRLGMLRDPLTRLLMRREDMLQSLLVTSLVAVAAIAAVLEIAMPSGRWAVVGGSGLAMAIPVAQVLRMSPGWPRRTLVIWSIFVGAVGIASTTAALIGPPINGPSVATSLLGLAFLAVLVLLFVGNRIARAEPHLSGG